MKRISFRAVSNLSYKSGIGSTPLLGTTLPRIQREATEKFGEKEAISFQDSMFFDVKKVIQELLQAEFEAYFMQKLNIN